MTPARLLTLAVLTAVAVGLALLLQRRRPDPPSAPSYRAPQQLDRDDFTGRAAQYLIALFSSATCDSCPRAWSTIEAVVGERGGEDLAVQRIDVEDDPGNLHARYRVDGVPTTVVADHEGVVIQAFFGPMDAEALRAALPPTS